MMSANTFARHSGVPAMPTPYTNASDQYLLQKITGASREQLAALLLEGAQRFVGQAIAAMGKRDIPAKARMVNKASAIVEELAVWLDHEHGGELAGNLARLYDWWLSELFEASQGNEPERLERIQRQMGELRESWEQAHLRQNAGAAPRIGLGSEGFVG